MDDPRRFPPAAAAPPEHARLFALAERSLAAAHAQEADACDAGLARALDALLMPDAGDALAALFAAAPSAAVYRHLWRILARRERAGAPDPAQPVRLFALPVAVIAARERAEAGTLVLPCVLADPRAAVSLLRDHGALAGNPTLALSNALPGVDALDFARVPGLLAGRTRDLTPLPIEVTASEGVHLRFLVGTALAAAQADLFRDAGAGAWGVPLTRALSSALAAPGATVLALPRPPRPLTEAAWQGRLAQREVSAQVFASNAIRKFRAATGEPSAVISVHETAGGGGEVRLSLSSALDERSAEGFCAPLWPLDGVADVVGMLESLLADCRVADVRRKPGVHPDRDPATGLPLLFKAGDEDPALH
ncbi:MAG: hypothetical protein IT518_08795 [Burkholderiales bacterium]|nr:hypothetical protein [Burkholderiales bacterium]